MSKQEIKCKKNKGGRPSSFKVEYVKQVYNLCAYLGADNPKLCKFFKCSELTLYNWGRKNPEFIKALKDGKDYYDTNNVEKTLLQRALGYSYNEITKQQVIDKQGVKRVIKKIIHKQVLPDVTAQIFYLKCRQPQRWKDRQDINVTSTHEHRHINIDATDLSIEQKRELLKAARRKMVESKVVENKPKQLIEPKKRIKRKKT